MSTAAPWLWWALASATLAALTAIFAKLGLQHVDADLALLLRTLLVSAVLAVLVVATGKWRNPLSLPAGTAGWLVLSAMATGGSWLCYFRALKAGPAAQVAPVDKLSLVLVALFAVAVLNEHLSAGQWCGLGLVSLGIMLMTAP